MKAEFLKGQKVYDVLKGWGTVECISEIDTLHPVIVDFGGRTVSYTGCGRRSFADNARSLYTEQQEIIPFKVKPRSSKEIKGANSTVVVEFHNAKADISLWITPKNIINSEVCQYDNGEYCLELNIPNQHGDKMLIDNHNYVEKNLLDYLTGGELIDDDSDRDLIIKFFEEKPKRKIDLLYVLNDFFKSGLTTRKNPVEKYLKLIELSRQTLF